MEKVLLYPYDRESEPIIKHNDLLKDLEIVSVVSPNGWGLSNEQFENTELRVSSDFDTELEKCTVLWIVDSNRGLSFDKSIYPKIKKALSENKKILWTRKVSENEQKVINDLIPIEKRCSYRNRVSEHIEIDTPEVFNIDTPVVFVCGLIENVDKFDIQLSIRRELLSREFKILQVGSKEISKLFGFNSIPEFMFNKNVSERDKIIRFNHFIKKKEIEEKPDLIIIGIPGEVLPFSKKLVGNFGITAYEITQTISPDCTIFSLPYFDDLKSVLEELTKLLKNRLNIDVDYYNIAERKIDFIESEAEKKFSYIPLSKDFIKKEINKNKYENIYALSESEDATILVDKIIEQLSEYANIVSV